MLQNKEEVLDEILDRVEDYEGSDFDTFENEVFNDDERNMYYNEAKDELEKFVSDEDLDGYETTDGVFGAIELIKEYESTEFGEVNTDFSNPCDIANMIDFIRGGNVFGEVMDKAGLDMDDDISAENLKLFKETVQEMLDNH